MMLALPPAPTRERVWRVRIPRKARVWLHFHLEAADGLAYLEDDPSDPETGLLLVPPGQEARLRDWLRAVAAELELSWSETESGDRSRTELGDTREEPPAPSTPPTHQKSYSGQSGAKTASGPVKGSIRSKR